MVPVSLVLLCCSFIASHGQSSVIKTDKGLLQGLRHRVLDIDVDEYLGIPFAKPPLGDLRFAKPVENDAWPDVLQATRRPNACWQEAERKFGDFRGSTMWDANTDVSEDCLYLNVWTPAGVRLATAAAARLPVMVWIHGGGFFSGSSALDVYDGRQLAAAGRVVVVAVNYRLGVLGFFAIPGSRDAPGNAGLHDQVAALAWVRRNAAAFGGDPASVTLFGASAGAASVAYHLLSPLSAPLFERAVLQTGTVLNRWAYLSADELPARNDELLALVGCGGGGVQAAAAAIACLRAASAATIVREQRFVRPYVPVMDSDFLPMPPRAAVAAGRFKRCPVLVGSNADEGSQVVAHIEEFETSFNSSRIAIDIGGELLRDLLRYVLRWYLPGGEAIDTAGIDAIVRRYAATASATIGDGAGDDDDTERNLRVLVDVTGDIVYTCPIDEWAELHASANATVYKYLFAHASSQKPWGAWTGVMHGDETPFVFGEPLRESSQYTADERLLSRHMIALWTNFARTGNPTNGSLIYNFTWPAYSAASKAVYELSLESLNGTTIVDGPRDAYCAFWRTCVAIWLESSERTEDPISRSPCCSPATRSDGWPMWMPLLFVMLRARCTWWC